MEAAKSLGPKTVLLQSRHIRISSARLLAGVGWGAFSEERLGAVR
jgi:hypothetical protein